MQDYQKLYLLLFNAITDALEELDMLHFQKVREILETAQQEAEELYISTED